MELIDKDALVAEIENRIKSANNDVKIGAIESLIISKTLNGFKSFLNTLEVKEVDLTKEISFQWSKFCLYDKDKDSFVKVAKHFFELGMQVSNKAQKGEEV